MNITLLCPYHIQGFGIRTLSSCLKKEGHNVKLVFLLEHFLNNYNDKNLENIINLCRGSDLVGISVMTHFFDTAVKITEELKKKLKIPILWGGIHPSIRPEECLDYADMVCLGEAEETIIELTEKIKLKKNFYSTKGMWLKKGEEIIKNQLRPLIYDLDSIPFQDIDYKNHYVLTKGQIIKINEKGLIGYMKGETKTGNVYITMATRGCPFSCTYCYNNVFNKIYSGHKIVRKRSVSNIIKELIEMRIKLPFVDYIKFDDDSFFFYNLEEMKDFCEKYKENIGLPLIITGATPLTLTREKFLLLLDAGLMSIRIGIQTGSERVRREIYKRYYSNQQIENSVRMINEFKDKINLPSYDIILDNPWESDEDLVESLIFLSKLPAPYTLNIFSLVFFPETELYHKAKEEGIMTNDLNEVYRRYYYDCKKTYLNKLFFLLDLYTTEGGRVSPKTMFLLTNKRLRKTGLSYLLYYLLSIRHIPKKARRVEYLIRECIDDIINGKLSRIDRYLNPIIRKKGIIKNR